MTKQTTVNLTSSELEQSSDSQLPDVVRRYYVNRKVVFTERKNAPYGMLMSFETARWNDDELSKQLTSTDEGVCIALIADSGMGKTTFLQYLSSEVQKLTGRAVFLVYLSSLKDKLPKTSECRNLSEALNIIGSALPVSKNLLLHKMLIDKENKASKEGDIWFFLDGFDDIPASETLVSVVPHLLQTQRVRIVISGRKQVELALWGELGARAVYLEPFRAEDQMKFLEKFWNVSREDPIGFIKFQRYAEQLLGRYNTNIHSYMKVPLLIRLLAEVYTDDFESFMQSISESERLEALSTEVFSVVSLFERFIKNSFDLNPYSKNDDDVDPLFEQYLFEHELAAINTFRDIPEMRDILANHAEVYNEFRKRIKDGKEKTLLINRSDPHIEFVHQSFAEYFVARYLYGNLQRCVDYLCSIFSSKGLCRRFFFWIVDDKLDRSSDQLSILSTVCGSNNLVAFWACEASCLGVLKSLSSKHDLSTLRSIQYGSLLHAAAKIGSYEICSFLLDEIKINVNDMSGRVGSEDEPSAQVLSPTPNHQTPLHLAVEFGHEAVARLLLEHSAEVNAPDSNSFTPLHVAAQKGHTELISLLTNHSADLNVQVKNGDTPLHFAIQFSHAECAKLLIDLGADVNISDKFGSTPLALATRKGCPSIVAELIRKSAKVDVQFTTADKGKTLLHLAAESGDVATVKQIAALSASVDALDGFRATPLFYAASKGHVEIVKLLIELKANVNALEPNTQSPLNIAVRFGHTDVVKALLDHEADLQVLDASGSTLLQLAAQGRKLDIVKLLIDRSIDVNAANAFKLTALHWAAKQNNPSIVKLLLDHSADPNISDSNGWTALHWASSQGCLESVALLVEQPINIDARTSKDQTLLLLAANSGYRDIVKILIGKSADLNARDQNSWTPLHAAVVFWHTNIWDLLITRDNVNAQDHNNCTPLLMAAQTFVPVESVKLLLDNGANVNATGEDGSTALHYAAEKGHFDIAELLIERSAPVDAQDASHRTPLHNAAEYGHSSLVQLLIDHSALVTAHTKTKNTPLHLATTEGHTECAKLLINATEGTPLHLANINAFNKRKWTPLHLAARHGYRAIAQLLIDTASAVVDARDKKGRIPLHMAANNGHLDVAELLISKSANVNAQDKRKWTPLHLAARSGHKKLVELLLRHSADVEVRDGNGKTALDLASLGNRKAVVRLLGAL